ncbi:hypothetical protein H0H92_007974, partial [Tricholoma furcatifolium]
NDLTATENHTEDIILDKGSESGILQEQHDVREPEPKPEVIYRNLKKLIEKCRKELSNPKVVKREEGAAHTLLDLAALDQFNNLRFKLASEQANLKKRLRERACSSSIQHNLKQRISSIRPSTDAAKIIASRCDRGPYYARTLCSIARHLVDIGRLPESNQGKGALHATLLNNPSVWSALQVWVKGVLAIDEGGYEGSGLKRQSVNPQPFAGSKN